MSQAPDGSGAAGATGTAGGAGPAAIVGGRVPMGSPRAPVGAVDGPVAMPGGGTTCAEVTITPIVQTTPGNLLIVFDRSQSMTSPFGGAPRIEVAKQAVRDALTPFSCAGQASCEDALTVGAITFPSSGDPALMNAPAACPAGCFSGFEPVCMGCVPTVPGALALSCYVEPITTAEQIDWRSATDFVAGWDGYWNGRPLELGTPINPAFAQAQAAIAAADLPGRTAVLLLTDGQGTCPAMPVDAVQQARDWQAAGIDTHVITLAENNAFNERVAAAGGTTAALQPMDQAALTAVLSSIVESTVSVDSCDIPLDGGSITDIAQGCALGSVTLGADAIACNDGNADSGDGFYIRSATELVLTGAACQTLMSGAILSATFPCEILGPE